VAEKLRLDKWLWHARFFKTRSLAASVVTGGGVRVNAVRVHKSSTLVSSEDVLTFQQADMIRVIRVDALGHRRGPASEAQKLYTDLAPPQRREPEEAAKNPAYEGKGRPTKRNRRTLDLSRARSLE
jgi:ribosome-associated heat shock protein Hsp15